MKLRQTSDSGAVCRTLLMVAPGLLSLTVAAGHVKAQHDATVTDLEVNAETRAAIVDTVSGKLKELYLFPRVAAQMEEHLRNQHESGAYDHITSLSAFVNQLTQDLLSVYPDGHLHVSVLEKTQPERRPTEDESEWWERRVREAQYHNFFFRSVEWLPGNVGYFDWRRMEYPSISGPTAVAVMGFLANCDALIIDLRHNPGGRSELSQLILSYFFEDHRVHYLTSKDRGKKISKQWWTVPYVPGQRMPRIPLYLLTSRDTGSAAEQFAYVLKHLGRATVVGERTAGAAHTTHRHIFPDLHIALSIPDGTKLSPVTGKDWEGEGVIPHIEVPLDRARDVAYGEALRVLLEGEADEITRRRLKWAKDALNVRLTPVHLNAHTMKQYVGVYGPRRITSNGDTLYYQREGRAILKLVPLGDDRFMLDGSEYFRIQFTRDASGKVHELVGLYDDGRRDVSKRSEK